LIEVGAFLAVVDVVAGPVEDGGGVATLGAYAAGVGLVVGAAAGVGVGAALAGSGVAAGAAFGGAVPAFASVSNT